MARSVSCHVGGFPCESFTCLDFFPRALQSGNYEFEIFLLFGVPSMFRGALARLYIGNHALCNHSNFDVA